MFGWIAGASFLPNSFTSKSFSCRPAKHEALVTSDRGSTIVPLIDSNKTFIIHLSRALVLVPTSVTGRTAPMKYQHWKVAGEVWSPMALCDSILVNRNEIPLCWTQSNLFVVLLNVNFCLISNTWKVFYLHHQFFITMIMIIRFKVHSSSLDKKLSPTEGQLKLINRRLRGTRWTPPDYWQTDNE